MVELMGGTLTVRSTRGAGATFTVRMPRIQG
jgi:signal transduction histidine kinase